MKNKGVFITILLILVVGIATTASIYSFVTERRTSVSAAYDRATASELSAESFFQVQEEESGQSLDQGETLPETVGSETQEGMGRSRMRRQEENLTEPAEQTALFSDGPSVLTDAQSGEAGYYLLEELVTGEDFQKKLKETDKITEELRQSGSASNTTDSMKMTADYEYRLWDTELNRIYQAILNRMSEKEAELFRTEERTWIRNRDQTARQAAEKFSGGTMESLEYTASLTASTRARAYDMLEQYGDLLP